MKLIDVSKSREVLNKAAFDLKCWQQGQDFFTCKLFDLIAKADSNNRNKIRIAFPAEVSIFEEWQRSRDKNSFFKKWGVIL